MAYHHDELESEEKPHHEPMKKTLVSVKQGLPNGQAVEDAADRGDQRPQERVEHREETHIGDFNGWVVSPQRKVRRTITRKPFKSTRSFMAED